MAANAYIMGGGFTTLNSVLESNGPQDLIDRLSILNQVGASDAVALARYKSAFVIAQAAQAAAAQVEVVFWPGFLEVFFSVKTNFSLPLVSFFFF